MKRSMLLVCTVALTGLLMQPVSARDRQNHRSDRNDERSEREQHPRDNPRQRGNQAETAARIAQQQNGGGRVLSVNPDGNGYRVKLLKDGEVRSYFITVE